MAKKKVIKKKTPKVSKKITKRTASKTISKKTAKKQAPVKHAHKNNQQSVPMGLAILSLVINIILPGLGSILGYRTKEGIWQLVLLGLGAILTITIILSIIGIPMILAAWIWGIVTGARLIQEASN